MNTSSATTVEHRVTNLAALFGRWKFGEGRLVYERPENPSLPFGICVSNIRFLEGEAQVMVQRTDATIEARILLGYRSQENEYLTVGIGGGGRDIAWYVLFPGLDGITSPLQD
jgi:hypothetical protein